MSVTALTGTVAFAYDGDGQRVLRADGSGTTIYVSDHYERQGSAVTKY